MNTALHFGKVDGGSMVPGSKGWRYESIDDGCIYVQIYSLHWMLIERELWFFASQTSA